jgi:hypothetical protein
MGVAAPGAETIWIEAEHFRGVRGHCFPEVDKEGKARGFWSFSGPGLCGEWSQGGESGWLSIACAPEESSAQAEYDVEVPVAGRWRLWVRYRDWRGQTELFAIRVEQAGKPPATLVFGSKTVVEEEDELKLLWNWAFGWDAAEVELAKGPARVILSAHSPQQGHRQIDCLCLTTDFTYRPRHRERPSHPTWETLELLRQEPALVGPPLAARTGDFTAPPRWKPLTFRDRGLLYLWNVGPAWLTELGSSDPQRIQVPFHIDEPLLAEFRQRYGGQQGVPIFSDPRIVPTFHAAGPNILDDARFVRWLEANPDRFWAILLNYTDPTPLSETAKAAWPRFRERFVGAIHGESLGVLQYDHAALAARTRSARTRQELVSALTDIYLSGKSQTEARIFGQAVEAPYRYAIPCQSSGMTAYAHLCRRWGAQAVGYENTSSLGCLAMRWAFLRGSARQYPGLTAAYRSCNFGDAATIYAEKAYFYAAPRFVLDNWYDVFAGAGMTWYKFDIWHSYFAGCSLFYHEQGHDEFWKPGGQSAGSKPLQLSPKGKLVEQFLRLTQQHPDRGVPFTPIAFLLDPAHGWDPNHYQPSYFDLDLAWNEALLRYDRHARMLQEIFWTAYHPYGPRESALHTGVSPCSVPGMFGNIFDVLVADPDHMDILADYPVVVLAGEISVSEAVGRRLRAYLEAGGTLVVFADQLTGPGTDELKLPPGADPVEADAVVWLPAQRTLTSQRYRFRPLGNATEPIAQAPDGAVVAAAYPRGQGRLIYVSIPLGLGLDGRTTPVTSLLLAALRQGLVPVHIDGEAEWMLNKTEKGWIVVLFNPAGCAKPQHGIVPTDYGQERRVTLRWQGEVRKATEWFTQGTLAVSSGKEVRVELPAGAVRIVEIEGGT